MTPLGLDALRVTLDGAVQSLEAGALPRLIGLLAETAARAQARLTAPTLPSAGTHLTAEQLAETFGVPTSQIYEQARQGRIPSIRMGKYVRFDLTTVMQALAAGEGSEMPALGTRKKPSNGAGNSGAATAALPTRARHGGGR